MVLLEAPSSGRAGGGEARKSRMISRKSSHCLIYLLQKSQHVARFPETPCHAEGEHPCSSWLLGRRSPPKTAALPRRSFSVTVSNAGCQPCRPLQLRDALETAGGLSKALTARSFVPAEPKMTCKPPQEQGYGIPACCLQGCDHTPAGGDGEGLGEGAVAGTWEPPGTWGTGRAAQLPVPIPFALYIPRSLELVWISKEETEPTPSTRSLPPFPAPPLPV